MPDVAPGYVAIGRVAGAFGLRGELKVEPLAPAKQFRRGLTVLVAGRECAIERVRGEGRLVYVKLAGIDAREEAQSLRGEYLQVPEGDLPPLEEGQYYRYQLTGLAVRTTDGRDLGRVYDVLSTAETDVFVIRGPLGEILVPAVDDIVIDIDVAGGMLTIEAVPGLLPEEPAPEP